MYSVLILHMNLLPAMAMVTALEVLTGSVTFSVPPKGPGCPFLRPGPTWHSHGTCWQGAVQWLHPLCSGTALKPQPLALFWAMLQLWLHWSYCTVLALPQTCPVTMDLSGSHWTGGWTRLSPDFTLRLWECVPFPRQWPLQPVSFAPWLQLHKHVV